MRKWREEGETKVEDTPSKTIIMLLRIHAWDSVGIGRRLKLRINLPHCIVIGLIHH